MRFVLFLWCKNAPKTLFLWCFRGVLARFVRFCAHFCTFGFWVFYFLLNFLASGQVSKCERCMLGIYTSSSTATVSASMGIILPFLVGRKKIAALQLRQGTDLPVRICLGSMLWCGEIVMWWCGDVVMWWCGHVERSRNRVKLWCGDVVMLSVAEAVMLSVVETGWKEWRFYTYH